MLCVRTGPGNRYPAGNIGGKVQFAFLAMGYYNGRQKKEKMRTTYCNEE